MCTALSIWPTLQDAGLAAGKSGVPGAGSRTDGPHPEDNKRAPLRGRRRPRCGPAEWDKAWTLKLIEVHGVQSHVLATCVCFAPGAGPSEDPPFSSSRCPAASATARCRPGRPEDGTRANDAVHPRISTELSATCEGAIAVLGSTGSVPSSRSRSAGGHPRLLHARSSVSRITLNSSDKTGE